MKERRPVPFREAFLLTHRAYDDVMKKEWADDVERRLREVLRLLRDQRPPDYAIERSNNRIYVYTVTSNELSKENIAALSAGRWPGWKEIVLVVPELEGTMVEFDTCVHWEWYRYWDVEDEESLFRLENGIFY